MSKITKINVGGVDYELGGSGTGKMVEITHAELKALKDSSSLEVGTKYRITDYVGTFKTLKSANHPFDIVVEALSESVLSEKASAMRHEGDEYFTNAKMELWEIWYSLENDTTRFTEAAENGKGFIFKLKDEYGNDVCFDFKNALFTLTSEEYPFITASSGSMDFYLFSCNTGTANDISNQNNIADRSVLYPTTVMNNTINFSLTAASFCIVFLFDKYILASLEKNIKISDCTILSNSVVIPLFSVNTSTRNLRVFSGATVKVKNWCILNNITISNSITIEGNQTFVSMLNCNIKNVSKIIVNTSASISNTDFRCSGYSDGTLIIPDGLISCIVSVYFYSTDLSYTLPEAEDKIAIKNKLIWGKSDEPYTTTIKVIDPFTLAT